VRVGKLGELLEDAATKALIVDVDGTLYRQFPVRQRMLLRLASHALVKPREIAAVFRAVGAYRRAQESMRHACPECSSLSDEQIRIASGSCGLPASVVARYVAAWMETAPLDLLRPAMRKDVANCLQIAKQKGMRLGIWSDYPAASKLKAMRLDSLFDVIVCAQDPDVQRFKPDPRGLEVALSRLEVSRDEAVYIGDRRDVDAVAAARAGVRCVIVG
jgi:FMN phosphatase YigB (HAD superfamily)